MTDTNPFADWHVVSVYTDAQAVEDGVLVAINSRDRVSRAAFDFFHKATPINSQPPNNWPVAMMDWFTGGKVNKTEALAMIAKYGKEGAQREYEKRVRDAKAVALAKGLIGKYERQARKVYDENIGGGILSLWAVTTSGVLSALSEAETFGDKLWLMPNENGGVTLMFPDDY